MKGDKKRSPVKKKYIFSCQKGHHKMHYILQYVIKEQMQKNMEYYRFLLYHFKGERDEKINIRFFENFMFSNFSSWK